MSAIQKVPFTGNMCHKLDPKSRVAVPAHWRVSHGCSLRLIEAKREGYNIIKCYTEESFASMVHEVKTQAQAKDFSARDIDAYLGLIIGKCCEADLNSQGKLLIPKNQREGLALSDSVHLVGRGDYF